MKKKRRFFALIIASSLSLSMPMVLANNAPNPLPFTASFETLIGATTAQQQLEQQLFTLQTAPQQPQNAAKVQLAFGWWVCGDDMPPDQCYWLPAD